MFNWSYIICAGTTTNTCLLTCLPEWILSVSFLEPTYLADCICIPINLRKMSEIWYLDMKSLLFCVDNTFYQGGSFLWLWVKLIECKLIYFYWIDSIFTRKIYHIHRKNVTKYNVISSQCRIVGANHSFQAKSSISLERLKREKRFSSQKNLVFYWNS